MRVELFSIGKFHVYSYGFMIAIGIIVAYLVGSHRAKKKDLNPDYVFDIAIWCAIGGFVGAKLLYCITEFDEILEHGISQIFDGFVVYGGIIGGILTGYIYCRVKKIDFLKYFDLVMPSIAIAQGFGRIGCFLAGCCYGKETDSFIGVVFPESSPYAISGVKVIPTQLISSAANFIHAFILMFIAKKVKKDGVVASLYLVFYSVGRFLIEFLRNDPRGNVGVLSTSQFISVFMFIIGIAMLIVFLKKKSAETVTDNGGKDEDNISAD